jgi:hypothetical protein
LLNVLAEIAGKKAIPGLLIYAALCKMLISSSDQKAAGEKPRAAAQWSKP